MAKRENPPALIALADQMQQMCSDAGVDIAGFIIITFQGRAEIRSRLSDEDLKSVLAGAAEAL